MRLASTHLEKNIRGCENSIKHHPLRMQELIGEYSRPRCEG